MEPTPDRHDGQLLAAFAHRGDAAAFATVARRHEKLVWSVCYSILRQTQDAEDAAQAVFLTLAAKAGALVSCPSVGPWLHSVAHNVAVNAARLRASRAARDRKAASMSRIAQETAPDAALLKPLVHAAVEKLPGKERQALILFHFEGRSVAETASALGSPVSTVEKWLARGRERVRKVLARQGITLSVLALLPVLSVEAGVPCAPAALASAAASAAALGPLATGAGVVSSKVLVLTKGALKMLFYAKLKVVALVLAAVGGASGALIAAAPLRPAPDPVVGAPAREDTPAERETRLQAALKKQVRVAYKRAYSYEVLEDLQRRVGLRYFCPYPLCNSFVFSLQAEAMAVRQVLENLAAAGKLELEFVAGRAVLWKKTEDQELAALGKALSEGDEQAKSEAAYDLGKLGDRRAVALLAKALDDPSPVARYWVARGIINYGPLLRGLKADAAFLRVVKEILARHEKYAHGLITTLGALDDPNVKAWLKEQTQAGRSAVGYSAKLALEADAAPLTAERIEQMLKGGNAGEGYSAATAALQSGDPTLAPRLVEALRKDIEASRPAAGKTGEPAPRATPSRNMLTEVLLCQAIADLGDEKSCDEVLALLEQNAGQEKEHMLHSQFFAALTSAANAKLNAKLLALFRGAGPDLKAEIATGWHTCPPGEVAEEIVRLARSGTVSQRATALASLGAIYEPQHLPLLLEAAGGSDVRVKWAAVQALGNCRDEGAFDALVNLYERMPSGGVLSALVSLRGPRLADRLVQLWDKRRDPDLLLSLARSQARRALSVGMDIALQEIKSADGKTRSFAAYILGFCDHPRAADALLDALEQTTDRSRRFAVMQSLQQIGHPRLVPPLLRLAKRGGDAQELAERCLEYFACGDPRVTIRAPGARPVPPPRQPNPPDSDF